MITNKVEILSRIAAEHKKWELESFGHQEAKRPALGMIEELGELAHCLLKFQQGIRGFEVFEKYVTEARDAIADIGIYLISVAWKNQQFTFNDLTEEDFIFGVWAIPQDRTEHLNRIVAAEINYAEVASLIIQLYTDTVNEGVCFDDLSADNIIALFIQLEELAMILFGVSAVDLIESIWKGSVQKRDKTRQMSSV